MEKSIVSDLIRILDGLVHKRVESEGEVFNLYQLGLYQAEHSLFNVAGSCQEIVELVELEPAATYKSHYHEKSEAIIYIVSGKGVFILGEEEIAYDGSLRVSIPNKILHGFKTETRTLFLSIQSPPILNYETNEVDIHY